MRDIPSIFCSYQGLKKKKKGGDVGKNKIVAAMFKKKKNFFQRTYRIYLG